MTRTGFLPTLLAGALVIAPAAGAQAPQAAPTRTGLAPAVERIFEAAGRGDVGPIERALGDPATDAGVRILLRAGLAESRLDPAAARDPALVRLAAEGANPALRRAALGLVTRLSFANGDYAEAARAGRLFAERLAADGQAAEAASAERTWRVAAMLAGRPRQGREGAVAAGSTPARADRIGLTRIDIKVNGTGQEAVLDTGANLSVLSAETARRLGVRVLDGETPVGNAVQGTVPVRIGIAGRLEIAGTMLTEVPFLVIDDANLTFPVPGGYDIKAIIGLPALRALGRIRVEQAGRFIVLPPPQAAQTPLPNLHASGNELFVDMAVDGRPVPLHLDTGANRTALTALYAAANPAAVAALGTATGNTASAGGARSARVAVWTDVPAALAGRSFRIARLQIALPAAGGPPPRFYGVLGADVLRRFASYTIDFTAMRLELGEPVEALAN